MNLEELLLSVGKQVRDMRDTASVSQIVFGELSGVPHSRLPALENGKVNMTLSTLHQLATSLGYDVNVTLTRNPDRQAGMEKVLKGRRKFVRP